MDFGIVLGVTVAEILQPSLLAAALQGYAYKNRTVFPTQLQAFARSSFHHAKKFRPQGGQVNPIGARRDSRSAGSINQIDKM